MGSCIICGVDVDGGGRICDPHQEDVVFDFRGNSPDQLVSDRFYRGVVDGYAEFGVFVDLSPGVTGLLHRSELDQRLDSLDWEPGDEVFVQVKGVRDNGNIDLAWSIRQADREFRGVLVQDGDTEYLPDEDGEEADEESDAESDAEPDEPDVTDAEPTDESDDEPVAVDDASETDETDEAAEDDTVDDESADEGDTEESSADESADEDDLDDERERVGIGTLADAVGEAVRIDGEVVSVRQTGGPTVFEVRDETGVVDVAAFVEPGVRAYPDVEVGDAVRIDGEVESHRGDVQVESEALVLLEGEEAESVRRRLAE
ncbi:DNA-binding protein, partial [Halorubrum saccharovorum]